MNDTNFSQYKTARKKFNENKKMTKYKYGQQSNIE